MHLRSALIACGLPILIAAIGAPASAHVVIVPATLGAGTISDIVFRVPSERAGQATTRISVKWPANFPLASVYPRAPRGWHAGVTHDGKRVATVTWRDGSIAPGTSEDFTIRAGPMPRRGTRLMFPTVQLYSDSVPVRWIDPVLAGQPPPDHPAPSLTTR